MVDEVLPDVPYAQIIFTIPKMLRPFFLWDRSLYGELCRCAYAATRKFFQAHFPGLQKPVPAMVIAPQSFGSLANFHPHLHSLTSLGVFSRDGVFHPVTDAIDFTPLEELFREETFKMMLKKELITEERIELLRSWKHSGFHASADRRVQAGERKELQSLLEYMERPPVALKRLQYLDDGRVLYRGNYHPSLRRDHQLVSGLEFLAMLVPHIALRYECRIHCYGAISTTIRRELGWIQKDQESTDAPKEVVVVEEGESEFVRLQRKNWRRLIAKVWLDDPQLCAGCGKPMRVVSAISFPQQDHVIEKILRHRGEWHPPWKRVRKTRGPRGPPPAQEDYAQESFSQLRPEEEDEFSQVPPADDWGC